MKRNIRNKTLLLPVLLFLLVGLLFPRPVQSGGWFVLTLEDLPTAVTVDEPVVLSFVIRHHGQRPGEIAQAQLIAEHLATGERLTVDTHDAGAFGAYAAEVRFPHAGVWTWSWAVPNWSMTVPMPDLTVAPAPSADAGVLDRLLGWLQAIFGPEPALASPVPAADHGRDLFLAKGCVTCHTHAAYPDVLSVGIGPELTHYQAAPEFTGDWLRDPQALRPNTLMPNLELTESEIQALTAFLLQAE